MKRSTVLNALGVALGGAVYVGFFLMLAMTWLAGGGR